MNEATTSTRREFIKLVSSSSAALSFAGYLPFTAAQAQQDSSFEPNVYIKIFPDNHIILLIKHLEMGQGAFTGLATLMAEELDADLEQLEVKHSPVDGFKYGGKSGFQGVGGSSGLRTAYIRMRKMGALAKTMLIAAAAQLWEIESTQIQAKKGRIINLLTNQSISYGELAPLAATLPVPELKTVTLKAPEDFIYIGKKLPRMDTGKTDGSAIFTQDIQLEGMLTAVVKHPPKFSATLESFNPSQAKGINGVKKVIAIDTGVAVIATTFWAAQKGREQLQTKWNENNAETQSDEQILQHYRQQVDKPGIIVKEAGDTQATLITAKKNVSMQFEFPFLAHATMEPMNCVALVTSTQCEIWTSSQMPSIAQQEVAELLNLPREQITIHVLYAGGSFGRRGDSDYIIEAVKIARTMQGKPIKLVWDREDDMRSGRFRPMYVHRVNACIDTNNKISAWHQRIVGQSILTGSPFEKHFVKNGIDKSSIEGAVDAPYQIENQKFELHTEKNKIPSLWWRSVGYSHNVLVKEVMIDKLASEAGIDPITFRLNHLKQESCEAKLLNYLSKQTQWRKTAAPGRAKGVAVQSSFKSCVAIIAEVSLGAQGRPKVEKVSCVIDCGLAVNPDVVRAQIEGGIIFGLSIFLDSEIKIDKGEVISDNFDSYHVPRMTDAPEIDVLIYPSGGEPTGVGEPSTCVIAPAVINAFAKLTGKYHCNYPLKA